MSPNHKALVWLSDIVKTPPMGENARIEAGFLIRQVRGGLTPEFPANRPMPNIGKRRHELRIDDPETDATWRIFYRTGSDAVVILEWISQKTPKGTIDVCQ